MHLLAAEPFVSVPAVARELGPGWAVHTPDSLPDPALITAIACEKRGLTPEQADAYPNLRVVVTVSTGVDHLDIAGLTARGIAVYNVPDYCTEEVSDHALAAGLGLLRDLPRYTADQIAGRWDVSGSRALRRFSSTRVGVVGLGRIGAATIAKFRALGMTVAAAHGSGADPAPGAERAGAPVLPLDELLRDSDLVVLTGAPTPGAPPVLGAARLALLPAHAALVNVARAALVDLDALAAALAARSFRAAWFDVWDAEPPRPDDARTRTPGLFFSPHTGWCSREAEAELWRLTAACARVAAGEPGPYPALTR